MTPSPSGRINLHLINRASPGDGLIMTAAIRDLHLAYPGEYQTYVESPFGEVYEHNPYCAPQPMLPSTMIDMQYPLIHQSGGTGRHFTEGYRDFLEGAIKRPIPITSYLPELYLSQDERTWPSPVTLEHGYTGPYWILNAGVKSDYTLKRYPYWQAVVYRMKDRGFTVVQVGDLSHDHPLLEDVIDMRGKTNLRQLFRLSYYAEGALCAVSLQMVVMAALQKPCVVVNGGREGTRWQLNNQHRFLTTIGALPCCRVDGCWKSRQDECLDWLKAEGVPHCMKLITPTAVVEAVELYYDGGILTRTPSEVLV